MKLSILFLIFLTATFTLTQAQPQYVKHWNNAQTYYQAGNFEEYLRELRSADSLRPNNQIIMYKLAGAFALNNQKAQSVKYLHDALIIKADFQPEKDKDFESLKSDSEFLQQLALKETLLKAKSSSEIAFKIKEPGTHIESIAYNPADGLFYLGSINKRKILATNGRGEISEFASSGAEGLMAAFGMDVDATNQILWVTTSAVPQMENYRKEDDGKAAVFKYDLRTKKLVKKFLAPEGNHLFGDLVIVGEKVYVSDSNSNEIFVIENDNIRLLLGDERFINLQGITASPDGKLFISDYVQGIFRIDPNSLKVIRLSKNSNDYTLKGIDGLTLIDNRLLAVHNGTIPNRLAFYSLNSNQDMIVDYRLLENNNPSFGEPTMGTVINGYYYYIANSQWPLYNEENQFQNPDNLPIVILKGNLE